MTSRKTWILPAVLGFAAAFVVGAAAQTMTGGDASPWDWMRQSGYGMDGSGMGGQGMHGGQGGAMGDHGGHHGDCSAQNGTAGNGTYCDGSGPHGDGSGSCHGEPGPQTETRQARLSSLRLL